MMGSRAIWSLFQSCMVAKLLFMSRIDRTPPTPDHHAPWCGLQLFAGFSLSSLWQALSCVRPLAQHVVRICASRCTAGLDINMASVVWLAMTTGRRLHGAPGAARGGAPRARRSPRAPQLGPDAAACSWASCSASRKTRASAARRAAAAGRAPTAQQTWAEPSALRCFCTCQMHGLRKRGRRLAPPWTC